VRSGDTIRGGMKAYDEDFGKDWAKYGPTVNKITEAVLTGLAASGNPKAVAAGAVINYAVQGFGFLASLDKDDELGKIELNIPANGPQVENREWKFKKSASWWNPGISTWNYTVRYRITRS